VSLMRDRSGLPSTALMSHICVKPVLFSTSLLCGDQHTLSSEHTWFPGWRGWGRGRGGRRELQQTTPQVKQLTCSVHRWPSSREPSAIFARAPGVTDSGPIYVKSVLLADGLLQDQSLWI
jgi:hypothetical protein